MVFGLFKKKGLHERKLEHQLERDARLDPQHLADEIADVQEQLDEIPALWDAITRSNLKPEALEEQRRTVAARKERLEKRLSNLQHLHARRSRTR